MKEYGDEGFIHLLKEGQEEAEERDIRAGSVLVSGTMLQFKEREIMKRQLFMWLPTTFELLSKEMARIKYPNENRPDVIFTNAATTVNVTFSYKKDSLKEGQEEAVRDSMEQVVHRVHPTSQTIEKQTTTAGEHKLAWFALITPAIDTEIYNLMFFTSLKGRLLMGACNCLKADQEEWKDLFVQMLASARFV